MPGKYLGFGTAILGDWGPYGTAGWYICGPNPAYTLYSSLPSWISGVALPATTQFNTAGTWPATDPHQIALPPSVGGRSVGGWYANPTLLVEITATDSTPYLLSIYGKDNTAARTHTVQVQSPDGLTNYSSAVTSPPSREGWWWRGYVWGSIRIRIAGAGSSFPHIGGLLFDSYRPHLAGSIPPNAAGHFAL